MQQLTNRFPVSVQVAFKYGFYSSILLSVFIISLYYFGKHPLLIPVIYDVRILLLAVFIFFGIREFRDIKNGGIVHFWQGMLIGLLIAITLGFIAAMTIMIFGSFEPAFLSGFVNDTMAQLEGNKERFLESIGEEVYFNTLKNLPSTTLTDLALDYYLKTVVIGLFLTIIISIILRRQTTSTKTI